MGGSDTGATVLDGLVGDGELAEVVADHLGLEKRGTKKEINFLKSHCEM